MKKPGKELCRKIILIFLGTVGIAFLVFMSDNGKKLLQDEHGPVSYTHLTLPTKRIV